jgi:electron transport complex protein RnfB
MDESILLTDDDVLRFTQSTRKQFLEYTIDEPLCIGCAKCVKGCGAFGNGSLQLQVRHDRCVNCNECAIARDCPADAFSRVPANKPYLLQGIEAKPEERV